MNFKKVTIQHWTLDLKSESFHVKPEYPQTMSHRAPDCCVNRKLTESLVMISLQIYCNRDATSQRKTWLLPHARSRSGQKMSERNKNGEQEEKNKVKKKSSQQQITKSPMFILPRKNTRLWFPFI